MAKRKQVHKFGIIRIPRGTKVVDGAAVQSDPDASNDNGLHAYDRPYCPEFDEADYEEED